MIAVGRGWLSERGRALEQVVVAVLVVCAGGGTWDEIFARAMWIPVMWIALLALRLMDDLGSLELDRSKYDAQQARRVLDRLVGYQVSPLLWKKVRRGLSAGRVQSVAVRIIVEREREIRAFKAVEYWSVTAKGVWGAVSGM